MSKYISSIFFTLFALSLTAQTTISGIVKSADGQALAYANVLLYSAGDSSLIKVSSTDPSGRFQISPQGSCFVEISFVGMKPYRSPVLNGAPDYDLGVIEMQPSGQLKEVTVKAQQPILRSEADRIILNVDKSIASAGQSATDVLRLAPGVSIGANNQINMLGKTGVLIYINGKRTKTDLSSIPSELIESIEFITNPSAKYDAEGNAGIINIHLKRAKGTGWKGRVFAGTSYKTKLRTQAGVQAGYHKGKISFSSGLSVKTGTMPQQNTLTRNSYYLPFSSFTYDGISNIDQKGTAAVANASLDIDIDSRNTIGLLVDAIFARSENITNTTTDIIYIGEFTSDSSLLISNSTAPNDRLFSNANFNWVFRPSGKSKLNLDLNYGYFSQDEITRQSNDFFDRQNNKTDSTKIEFKTPSNIQVLSAGLDYAFPAAGGKLELGAKAMAVRSDNNFDFFNIINGNPLLDSTLSNHFEYKEYIGAGYFNFSRPLSKKVSLNLGLRMEATQSQGKLTTLIPPYHHDTPNDYIDWFPNASLSWMASPKDRITFQFGRRINRPNYYKLNPFEKRTDAFNGEKGNPFLNPEYANSFDISFSRRRGIQVKLGYSIITNLMARIEKPVYSSSFLTWDNLDRETLLNANITYPFAIGRTAMFQTSLNIFRKRDYGKIDYQIIDLTVNGFDIKAQSRIRLPRHFGIEWMGMYTSPTIWEGSFKLDRYWRTDLGISKAIMKGKGVVKLVLADIFNSQKLEMSSDFFNQNLHGIATSESQQVRLFFSYNFGDRKVKSARRRKTGIEEAKQRARSN